jgi:hypothetical protein
MAQSAATHAGTKDKDSMNDSHEFIFRDDSSCQRFAMELRRVHWWAQKSAGVNVKPLNVEIKEEFATVWSGVMRY